ncbi:MAG: SusD/RagB family nutrient-binding outer membrane lipoprotein [Hymenobacteraceae bacterium]|nr:SusD/RagB family nutrient-binding outer membrane lipoprotein [Hymenobacteraceae bacterium]
MKKALLLSLSTLLLATSCVDSLDDYNVDPKNPATVPGVALFAGAERSLAREITSTNVNQNPFRLYVQYWGQTTYYDESDYDIKTRQIDRNFWDTMYLGGGTTDINIEPGVLGNLKAAKDLIPNNKFATAKEIANQQACVEILAVYTWTTLVNTYGNVPYSEALDFNKPQPKYDDAKTIYADLFKRLDAAIGTLDPAAPGMGDADIIYKGDVNKWIKFGNSLKLRMALTLADVTDFTANGKNPQQLATEAAAASLITSKEEQAQVVFVASPPNTNPLWEDLVQSGRYDFVGASTFVDTMNAFNDPRTGAYFKPKPDTAGAPITYAGGVYGEGNNYSSFSAPGKKLEDPTLPGILLSYSEVEFLLAEVAARYATGGTVESHYEAAITASIQQWGGSPAAATAYLAQPTVAYATAVGATYKEKIGLQKWIALYDQPVTAWTEWRRLDTPHLDPPGEDFALSGIPLRLTYPTPEKNLNGVNNAAASAAIGGDNVASKIFWDKF